MSFTIIVSYNITKEIKMKVKEKTQLRSEIQEATLPSEIVTADKKNNCEYQSLKQTMNTKNVKNEFHFNQYGTNNTQIGNVENFYSGNKGE